MVLWFFSFLTFLIGMKFLLIKASQMRSRFGIATQRRSLRKVALSFKEIEDLLGAGLVPTPKNWAELRKLPHPWGALSVESLEGLRAAGGAILPTLRRLRDLAQDQDQCLASAQAKSSQAFAQAMTTAFLIPILGGALFMLLPVIRENNRSWMTAIGVALILAGIGSYWLLVMTESARWGGVREEYRSWILGSQCAGERFLALVRSGTPPDLAWVKTCQLLCTQPGSGNALALAWGYSVWDSPESSESYRPTEQVIVNCGASIRKAVQLSMMEGRPCLERVETALSALRSELKSQIERELSLLSTRALKPLFICAAPGVFGLIFMSLWLIFQDAAGGSSGAF